MVMTVLVTIAMNLYARISMGAVLHKVAQGLRYIWPDPEYPVAQASAFSYRRYQVGPRPLVNLFHRVCQPMATPETPGAFLFGLRLMALDGTVEDVPDTAENVATFGRQPGDRGDSAFAQIQAVYLAECGTHAIVDAGFWPCRTSERVGGFRMLRSVTPDMLVMWDRGFHDFDMFQAVLRRHGHAFGRLPAHVKPQHVRTLPDGSYLAYIYPSDYQRRKRGEQILLRIVEYTITDPALPGCGEVHRLATTLLDHRRCSALDLACCYHERWEIELVIDEVDDHQRLAGRPLRSLKPLGVIQELYALEPIRITGRGGIIAGMSTEQTPQRTRARTRNNKTTTDFRVSDALWAVLLPLLPVHVNTHRFGGGRPRVPDRPCADAIFYVLRTGCQWQAWIRPNWCRIRPPMIGIRRG